MLDCLRSLCIIRRLSQNCTFILGITLWKTSNMIEQYRTDAKEMLLIEDKLSDEMKKECKSMKIVK